MLSDKKKTILFVIRNLGIGGAQKILLFVANTYAELGFNVSIISLSSVPNTMPIHQSIKVYYLNYEMREVKKKNLLNKTWRQLLLLIRIRLLIRSIRPHIIYAFMSGIIKTVLYACCGMNIPIVGSERDNPYDLSKERFKYSNDIYERCDAVVFQTKGAMQAFGQTIQAKSYIIPNPAIPRVNTISLYTGKRKPVFVAAGRLEDVKQFDVLVLSFKKVLEKHADFMLHIYGNGSQKESLQKLVERENLSRSVVFKGEVNDVFALENDCSALILSSRSEGIPNVLIEAMSIGIPCISTDCKPGGPRLLLKDGQRGLLVPVGDKEALANAMCTFIEQPDLAKQYGIRGLEVNDEFAPGTIAAMWLDVLNKILNDTSRRG